jgi:hypothetical protein
MRGFKSSTDRTVWLEAIHIQRTYQDRRIMLGDPDDRYNRLLVKEAASSGARMWGARPMHLLPPQSRTFTDAVGRTYPLLPELRYQAWLNAAPLALGDWSSELVVFWFGSGDPGAQLHKIVDAVVSGLPWEQVAREFCP